MREEELYEPMEKWLHQYLVDKYKGFEIVTLQTPNEYLDKALEKNGVIIDAAVGVKIQIDVLGIARKNRQIKLFFIEAKKTPLVLRDLGQLWAYCKLVDPEEAFLLSSEGLGSLNRLLNVFYREDLLDFGDGKRIKKMKVGKWDTTSNSIDYNSLVPNIQ